MPFFDKNTFECAKYICSKVLHTVKVCCIIFVRGHFMDNGHKNNEKFIAYIKNASIEHAVEYLLFRLGFKCNLQGTKFLQEAIVCKYTTKIDSLSKQLYPQIAAKYETKGERVERSIRHTINECYSSGNLNRANDLLGCNIISNYPPTNSEFISAICTWLRLERINETNQKPATAS